MPQLLFISDLHLSSSSKGALQLFLKFLKTDACNADALYILGDLFDSWVGDDDNSELADRVREGLQDLSRQTPIYFQPGNRDFLIGERFAKSTGIQIIDEETIIEIHKQRALIMHGDLLCTDDLDYQHARKTLRSEKFISDFMAKPLPERIQLAAHYRKLSGDATAIKATDIMDTNQQTVWSFMQKNNADLLIHGHTHRPADHHFTMNEHSYHRLVLAAWQDNSAPILRLDYSADNPGMTISRYQAGTENNSGAAL